MIFEKERKKRKMKSTIQHYGWLVCTVIIIAIMIGIAGPAANFVKANFAGTVTGIGDKMNEAIGGGNTEEGGESDTYSPYGLYQTGALALYKERGIEAVKDIQITSWDELVSSGAIVVENGAVSLGFVIPDNLPEKNEYGFYYDIQYTTIIYGMEGSYEFHEDGSVDLYLFGELFQSLPAESAVYSENVIELEGEILAISSDGAKLSSSDGMITLDLGNTPNFAGDLILPKNGSITSLPDFLMQPLTGIAIPAAITSIGSFDSCEYLTTVIFDDGSQLTNISGSAFRGCENLVNIEIPNSVTNIGSYAFSGCSNLATIKIPNSVTNIGNNAFAYCEKFEDIEIPKNVTTIGARVFANCSGLRSVIFENDSKLEHLNEQAFQSCAMLEEVLFGNNSHLLSIEKEVFGNCESITNIEIPASVTYLGELTFSNCTNLTSVIFNENSQMASIGKNAFSNCINLENIELPESLIWSDYAIFAGCANLTTVTILSFMPPDISDNSTDATYTMFAYNSIPDAIYVPYGSSAVYNSAERWSAYEDIIQELPLSYTEISDTWEEIIAHVNAGTYVNRYKVGQLKSLDLGSEGIVVMQIAAINVDVLSNGSGSAHITWIAIDLLTTRKPMNTNRYSQDSWETSSMRSYLQNDIWALIDPTVQNVIVAVDKTYYDYTTQSTKTCSDTLWIPSYRELGYTDAEDTGTIYSQIFKYSGSFARRQDGQYNKVWWLRSSLSTAPYYFGCSAANNNKSAMYADSDLSVAIGFCM